jgi:hypothetical protein
MQLAAQASQKRRDSPRDRIAPVFTSTPPGPGGAAVGGSFVPAEVREIRRFGTRKVSIDLNSRQIHCFLLVIADSLPPTPWRGDHTAL